MNNGSAILELRGVHKSFTEPTGPLRVLEGLSLEVRCGEIVLLQGPSGSGKTTLLQIAGVLLRADAGEVRLARTELNQASEAARTEARRRHLGFVFQHFHLVEALSVRDNVALGLRLKRQLVEARRVTETLQLLGIAAKADKLPGTLSGGEKQRTALARALAPRPDVLLADEPTSQLDAHAADALASLIQEAARQTRVAVVIATHDARLHRIADRLLTLQDGRLYE
ncbi:MAG: ABC transporter ATP-binding protein [Verrucomicrobiae bacterium]|nr:ABC transporter ATP-binding protein [Verrucomicrobiae bacterium]